MRPKRTYNKSQQSTQQQHTTTSAFGIFDFSSLATDQTTDGPIPTFGMLADLKKNNTMTSTEATQEQTPTFGATFGTSNTPRIEYPRATKSLKRKFDNKRASLSSTTTSSFSYFGFTTPSTTTSSFGFTTPTTVDDITESNNKEQCIKIINTTIEDFESKCGDTFTETTDTTSIASMIDNDIEDESIDLSIQTSATTTIELIDVPHSDDQQQSINEIDDEETVYTICNEIIDELEESIEAIDKAQQSIEAVATEMQEAIVYSEEPEATNDRNNEQITIERNNEGTKTNEGTNTTESTIERNNEPVPHLIQSLFFQIENYEPTEIAIAAAQTYRKATLRDDTRPP